MKAYPLRARKLLSGSIFLAAHLFIVAQVHAQQSRSFTPGMVTPSGLLDTVIDNYGNKYPLNDISIFNSQKGNTKTGAKTTASSCSSGYFQLYLETGSGFEGTDAASLARLNVLCQVCKDISSFIVSPLATSTSGQKINIWVRNISAFGSSASMFAGLAISFHNLPYSATTSGIADNTIWITAMTGKDAFTNVSSPLAIPGGYISGSTYYHGICAFSHSGSVNWHTNLGTSPTSGETDLYTVALHEILHSLGFMTQINYNGNSIFGAGYPYFSRYDQHLQTQSGTPLITSTSASSCGMYNYSFNTTLTPFAVLSPGGTTTSCPSGYLTGTSIADHTVCSTAVKYVGGTTQNVYNPSCYEKGSSLSHFEDECYVPSGFPLTLGTATNNQYFVMANRSVAGPYSATTNPGAMKRYPTPEERKVLCDIGYTVDTTFGHTATLNSASYSGGRCTGIQVAGINDGLDTNGGYSFLTAAGSPVQINGGTAGSLLANDYGAASFKCLEVVIGAGTLSATTGTATTAVTFTPATGSVGLQLLRYIPVSTSGAEGNITYVYLRVSDPSCTYTVCDLVPNGDFENANPTQGGDINTDPTLLHCWAPLHNSPDLFTRNFGGINGIPNLGTRPTTEVFNFPDSAHNRHWIGIYGEFDSTIWNRSGITIGESGQVQLTSSLIPGAAYELSFWVKLSNARPDTMLDHYIEFLGHPSATTLAPAGALYYGRPAGFTSISPFIVSSDGYWHHLTKTFTYSDTVPGNTLVFSDATYLDPDRSSFAARNTSSALYYYMFFDNISIRPIADVVTFTLPDTLCLNDTLIDLTRCVSVPGGVFTWDSVASGSHTSAHGSLFNASAAYQASLLLGDTSLATITYNYTNRLGCVQNVYKQVRILNSNATPITGPTSVIEGNNITLRDTTAGGRWYSTDTSMAVINLTTGVLTGKSAGTVIIHYRLPSGCYVSTTIVVMPGVGVHDIAANMVQLTVVPNPNSGAFVVRGSLDQPGHTQLQVAVTGMLGNIIYSATYDVRDGKIDWNIKLPDNLPAGYYNLRVYNEGSFRSFPISVMK